MGANVSTTDEMGFTPLHVSVQNGFIDVVDLLIDEGAPINVQNKFGYSPLSVAVEFNDPEMVSFLIEKGARVNQKITLSMSPLDLAKANRNDSIVKLLRKNNARTSPLPAFNKITAGALMSFNRDDFFMGLNTGFSDKKYNLDLYFDYRFRPFATRVLEQTGAATFYQYWERRAIFSVGADKKITLARPDLYSSFGVMAGVKGSVTFGSYRGIDVKPGLSYVFVPSAGLYYTNNRYITKLVYERMNLGLYGFQKGWVTFSYSFLFNRRQNVYYPKNIYWF
jgi:hypothetical protein